MSSSLPDLEGLGAILRRHASPAPPSDGLSFARACFKTSRLDEAMNLSALRRHSAAALEAHRRELWVLTRLFRFAPVYKYRGFSGPWLENRWINSFSTRPIEAFGGLVPLFVPWNDIWFAVHHGLGKWSANGPFLQLFSAQNTSVRRELSKLAHALRDDVAYVTVSQNDEGPFHSFASEGRTWSVRSRLNGELVRKLSGVLVLSSGGNGHVPLPLLKQPEPVLPSSHAAPSGPEVPVLTNVVGVDTMVRPARYALRYELLKSNALSAAQRARVSFPLVSHASARTEGATNATLKREVWGGKDDWRERAANASFVLTPRGGGRSAFIIYEAIQMGLLPIYVWDDVEWLPYEGTAADLGRFGFSVRLGTFRERAAEIFDASAPAEVARRRAVARRLRSSHFTYEGTLDQIARLLAHGTHGASGSDLRCAHHAPMGGPACPEWDRMTRYHSGYYPCRPKWYFDNWEERQHALEGRYPWLSFLHNPFRRDRSNPVEKLSEQEVERLLGLSESWPLNLSSGGTPSRHEWVP